MRKIHEVLRQHFEQGRSKREIARIINVSPSTVSDYVARAKLAGLSSPLPPECDDVGTERLRNGQYSAPLQATLGAPFFCQAANRAARLIACGG